MKKTGREDACNVPPPLTRTARQERLGWRKEYHKPPQPDELRPQRFTPTGVFYFPAHTPQAGLRLGSGQFRLTPSPIFFFPIPARYHYL